MGWETWRTLDLCHCLISVIFNNILNVQSLQNTGKVVRPDKVCFQGWICAVHRVIGRADEKPLPRRFPALGIPDQPWSQVLLPGLPYSSLHRNTSISPQLAVHRLPERLQPPASKFSHNTRSVSFKTENSCSSAQGCWGGSQRACCRSPGILKAGWGRDRGAEGDGHSQSLTRGHIVPGSIGWFLIHPQPTRHDQITAGPRIRFLVHLVLGTAPSFGNTWWGGGDSCETEKRADFCLPSRWAFLF